MKHSVMIKGMKSGIIVVLDENTEYETLKQDVAAKFAEASAFLGDAALALSFEGYKPDSDQQQELVDIICGNSKLKILCIVDTDERKEELFKSSLNQRLLELEHNTGQFYKGNLRSGQVLELETSVIIIGDVNSGAKVISKGNVIILGSLKGNVFAGAAGNERSFVVALEMSPIQIRIADIVARAPDRPLKSSKRETKIAFVEEGNIYIEPLNKDILSDIRL